jgi:hypothetical protein
VIKGELLYDSIYEVPKVVRLIYNRMVVTRTWCMGGGGLLEVGNRGVFKDTEFRLGR